MLATQAAYEEPMMSEIKELMICDTEEPIISDTMAPTHDQVAVRAYGYWLESGCREGTDEQNWLRAEQELIANQ
jgi:hypothetical protein